MPEQQFEDIKDILKTYGAMTETSKVHYAKLIMIDGETLWDVFQRNSRKPEYYDAKEDQKSYEKDWISDLLDEGKHVVIFPVQENGLVAASPLYLAQEGMDPHQMTPEEEQKLEEVKRNVDRYNADFYKEKLEALDKLYTTWTVERDTPNEDYEINEFREKYDRIFGEKIRFRQKEFISKHISDHSDDSYDDDYDDDYDDYDDNLEDDDLSIDSGLSTEYRDEEMGVSLLTLYLAAKGDCSFQQIADPNALVEVKKDAARLIGDHIALHDQEWLADLVVKGKEAVMNQAKKQMKNMDLNNGYELLQQKDTGLLFVLTCADNCTSRDSLFYEDFGNIIEYTARKQQIDNEAVDQWISGKMKDFQDACVQAETDPLEAFSEKNRKNFEKKSKIEEFKWEEPKPEEVKEEEPKPEEVKEETEESRERDRLREFHAGNQNSEYGARLKEQRDVYYQPFLSTFLKEAGERLKEVEKADTWMWTGSNQYSNMMKQLRSFHNNLENCHPDPSKEEIQSLFDHFSELKESVKAYQDYKKDPRNQKGSKKEKERMAAADHLESFCNLMEENMNNLHTYGVTLPDMADKMQHVVLEQYDSLEKRSPIYSVSMPVKAGESFFEDNPIETINNGIPRQIQEMMDELQSSDGVLNQEKLQNCVASMVAVEQIASGRRMQLAKINRDRISRKEALRGQVGEDQLTDQYKVITENQLEELTPEEKNQLMSGPVEKTCRDCLDKSYNVKEYLSRVKDNPVFSETMKNITTVDQLAVFLKNHGPQHIAKEMDAMGRERIQEQETEIEVDFDRSNKLDLSSGHTRETKEPVNNMKPKKEGRSI